MSQKKVSADGVKQLLKIPSQVSCYDKLDSTNILAKSKAADGASEGDLTIALSQTGGRGRMGRSFYSPEGSGIYFSLVLRPKIKAEDISLITPVAAVAVARAIEDIARKSPKIKWVNDLFIDNKKVCGILSEAAFCGDGSAEYVILGIGINLLVPKSGYPEYIKSIAGSVFKRDEAFNANELVAAIVNIFFELYADLKSENTLEEYQKRMMLIGSNINYIQNGVQKSGSVVGIDNKFRLIIKNEKGESVYLKSGEVTIGSDNFK